MHQNGPSLYFISKAQRCSSRLVSSVPGWGYPPVSTSWEPNSIGDFTISIHFTHLRKITEIWAWVIDWPVEKLQTIFWMKPPDVNTIPPEWQKNGGWKTTFLLGRPIFRGHVQFLGCKKLFVVFPKYFHLENLIHTEPRYIKASRNVIHKCLGIPINLAGTARDLRSLEMYLLKIYVEHSITIWPYLWMLSYAFFIKNCSWRTSARLFFLQMIGSCWEDPRVSGEVSLIVLYH